MKPPPEQQSPWRAVVLFVIAFALIGLAVLFRGLDSDLPSSGAALSIPDLSDWARIAKFLGISLLFIFAAGLGIWCGYLQVLRRLRKASRSHHENRSAFKV